MVGSQISTFNASQSANISSQTPAEQIQSNLARLINLDVEILFTLPALSSQCHSSPNVKRKLFLFIFARGVCFLLVFLFRPYASIE